MPQPTPPAWLPEFPQAIATADTARALVLLNGFATSHAGTAPARIKAQVVRAVVKHYRGDENGLFAAGMALAQ